MGLPLHVGLYNRCRPVASLPGGGGGFVGGPKGDQVGWGGVCVCGGGYYYSEWSRGGGGVRSNPPNTPPPGYGPEMAVYIYSRTRFLVVNPI